jgi:hypothetical protein
METTTMKKKLEDQTKVMINKLTEENEEFKQTIATMETTMSKNLEDQTKRIDKLTKDNDELE